MLAESFAAVSSTANYMEDFQEIKDYEESKFEINNDNKETPINDDFMIDELNFAIDKAKCTTPPPVLTVLVLVFSDICLLCLV